jgi:hypothetical protein
VLYVGTGLNVPYAFLCYWFFGPFVFFSLITMLTHLVPLSISFVVMLVLLNE